MILALHILSSLGLVVISSISISLNAKNKSQKYLFGGILTSTILSFTTGVGLILSGGNLARLCVFGFITIAISIYSAKRILSTNDIRIEL